MPVTSKTWAHLGHMAAELQDLSRAREERFELPRAPQIVAQAPMHVDNGGSPLRAVAIEITGPSRGFRGRPC